MPFQVRGAVQEAQGGGVGGAIGDIGATPSTPRHKIQENKKMY